MAANPRTSERTWRIEMRDGEPVFLCKFPDCKYEHQEPGGVQLHYIKKHGSSSGRESAPAGTNRKQQRQETGAERTPQQTKHRHAWRLLKPGTEVEGRAIAAGYAEICETCEELR